MVKYKSDYEDIKDRLVVVKEPERFAADLERRTMNFEGAVNITIDITIDSESVILQRKQSGNE